MREPGFYWVKIPVGIAPSETWDIGYWNGRRWSLAQTGSDALPDQILAVGSKIEPPSAKDCKGAHG